MNKKKTPKALWHQTVNAIGGEGARAICEALKTNTTLCVLNLNGLRQQEKANTEGGVDGMEDEWWHQKNRQQE